MPFRIVRGDITKMKTDAIVNAANESLLGGGGVDGAIHRAAGPELLAECRTLGGCRTGDAKITRGYRLPCRYVIHTVGPVWQGGNRGERELLASCCRRSLALAAQNGCETVALPLISAGAYGYPRREALQVITDAIREFLDARAETDAEMTITLVIWDRETYTVSGELFGEITAYIDDNYVERFSFLRRIDRRDKNAPAAKQYAMPRDACDFLGAAAEPEADAVCEDAALIEEDAADVPASADAPHDSLSEMLRHMDESFSEMLLRKIDERGMTDAACYKKANIDRKLFSKIRGDRGYRPSKPTVLAFAVALEMPLEETKRFLRTAGFAFSHSSKFDIIVEYFIRRGEYDVMTINEALFAFDQNLLGA